MNDMACTPVIPHSLRVGLVAYCALPPHHVFVRVPNENGRWVLTHRCVVEVACTHCNVIAGEPCKNPRSGRYWSGTHATRRSRYRVSSGGKSLPPHKPRLTPADLSAADAILEDA